ncbi:m-AAA protease-interacting protein 1, mitochondrial [Drosophila bipectinata]|uniref:m-AAA protease-interacting protein 1, mitochondrial n=1 Tax=Drosophila bipectinata TaxID=42026 RepID=UPI001C8AA563|nr:m-AAA protease-interacting protein 1, mitochondrial [Drosophila bipectinata]
MAMQHALKRCLGMARVPLIRAHSAASVAAIKQRESGLRTFPGQPGRRSFASLPQEEKNKKEPEESRESLNRLPRLMEFPEIIWPSALNTLKNWITIQFIIRPYFDSEFQLKDFIFGAKQALQVVSSRLMGGDLDSLDTLVSPEAISELRPVIQKLSMTQRRQLEIKESDIYLSFPYQVGIMFDEANDKLQKRFVEITMVFHVMRGLSEMRERGEEIPWNMGTLPEYQDKVFICNYRFIKEFTAGQQSDWTINVANHFRAIDLINESK